MITFLKSWKIKFLKSRWIWMTCNFGLYTNRWPERTIHGETMATWGRPAAANATGCLALCSQPLEKQTHAFKNIWGALYISYISMYELALWLRRWRVCSQCRRPGLIPELGRFPGGGHGKLLQHSHLENPHGQRSLEGYSPRGHKESGMSKRLSRAQRKLYIEDA